MTPPLQGIDHIHVFVADRAAAERWYADVLGFTRMTEFESWATPNGPLMIEDPSGSIQLALFEKPAQPCRSTIAFAADAEQFFAWRRHLAKALGREPEPVDHGKSWSMYFNDPDDNPYEITSYDYDEVAVQL